MESVSPEGKPGGGLAGLEEAGPGFGALPYHGGRFALAAGDGPMDPGRRAVHPFPGLMAPWTALGGRTGPEGVGDKISGGGRT